MKADELWLDDDEPIRLRTTCDIERAFQVYALLVREKFGKDMLKTAMENYDIDYAQYGKKKRIERMLDEAAMGNRIFRKSAP